MNLILVILSTYKIQNRRIYINNDNHNYATLINGSSQVLSIFPSMTRTLRITAPNTETSEITHSLTDTSVDFSSLSFQVDTRNTSNITSTLLDTSPQAFTINPTLEVTPLAGSAAEIGYSPNSKQ